MHRDLKSPNVLLSEEGVAKIADVGMVRSQVRRAARRGAAQCGTLSAASRCREAGGVGGGCSTGACPAARSNGIVCRAPPAAKLAPADVTWCSPPPPVPVTPTARPRQVKDLVTAQPVMTPLWAAPEVVRHERASIKVGPGAGRVRRRGGFVGQRMRRPPSVHAPGARVPHRVRRSWPPLLCRPHPA
jgi:serine/threonine protein kinase